MYILCQFKCVIYAHHNNFLALKSLLEIRKRVPGKCFIENKNFNYEVVATF